MCCRFYWTCPLLWSGHEYLMMVVLIDEGQKLPLHVSVIVPIIIFNRMFWSLYLPHVQFNYGNIISIEMQVLQLQLNN